MNFSAPSSISRPFIKCWPALVALTLSLQARADGKVLPFPLVAQEQSQWCWAATTRSMLLFYGIDVSQCTLAEYTRQNAPFYRDFGDDNCCVKPTGDCNTGNVLWYPLTGGGGSVEHLLNHYGIGDTDASKSTLSLDEIKNQINANRPFLFSWMWSTFEGHFLVGFGYDGTLLHYLDPWPGEGFQISEYSWVVKGADHSWDYSLTARGHGPCTDAEGASCNDANVCTTNDVCHFGTCAPGQSITCTALDDCHRVGVCDPHTGCTNPLAPEGSSCSDGNGCTRNDTCRSGKCISGPPATCPAPDSCHAAGRCDSITGNCNYSPLADGTGCDDHNLCTANDTCQNGICVSGIPTVCSAIDSCHTVGTCDPYTGQCSQPLAADATTCDDQNRCTVDDQCRAGVCQAGKCQTTAKPDSSPASDNQSGPESKSEASTNSCGCSAGSSAMPATLLTLISLFALRRRCTKRINGDHHFS